MSSETSRRKKAWFDGKQDKAAISVKSELLQTTVSNGQGT
jgi:hypothetical protein